MRRVVRLRLHDRKCDILHPPCFTSLKFGSPSVAVGEGILENTTYGVTVVAMPSESGINAAYLVTPTQFCGSDEGDGTLTKK